MKSLGPFFARAEQVILAIPWALILLVAVAIYAVIAHVRGDLDEAEFVDARARTGRHRRPLGVSRNETWVAAAKLDAAAWPADGAAYSARITSPAGVNSTK